MTNHTEDFDPFDQESTPTVSWTTVEDPDVIMPVGTHRTFEALGKADWVQQRDYDTGLPATWPLKPGETEAQPKMAAVVQVIEHAGEEADSPEVEHQHKGGVDQALWAGKAAKGATKALFNQIAAAQKSAKARIDEGTKIDIVLTGKKKDPAQPSKRAQNEFAVKITPNFYPKRAKVEVPDESDPFGGGAAPAADEEPPF